MKTKNSKFTKVFKENLITVTIFEIIYFLIRREFSVALLVIFPIILLKDVMEIFLIRKYDNSFLIVSFLSNLYKNHRVIYIIIIDLLFLTIITILLNTFNFEYRKDFIGSLLIILGVDLTQRKNDNED